MKEFSASVFKGDTKEKLAPRAGLELGGCIAFTTDEIRAVPVYSGGGGV